MKNIPAFTVTSGIAGLILEEIPYKQIAYIKILSSQTPEELLAECVSFCKAAGAEHIYATGHEYLETYPLHTSVMEMELPRAEIQQTIAEALPVAMNEIADWIADFNVKMFSVPNAATMTRQRAETLCSEGCAYYVYDGSEKIGLGVASGKEIRAIISLVPGRGQDVLCALCDALTEDKITVEVASNNDKAVRLYRRMGFTEKQVISHWYIIC